MIAVPAAAGCAGGVLLGNGLAVPLLGRSRHRLWCRGAHGPAVGGRGRPVRADLPGGPRPCCPPCGPGGSPGPGHRDRPGACHRARVRRAPATGRLALAAPPGDHRPRRAVRPPGAGRGHARRRRASATNRGDLRGRPRLSLEHGGRRACSHANSEPVQVSLVGPGGQVQHIGPPRARRRRTGAVVVGRAAGDRGGDPVPARHAALHRRRPPAGPASHGLPRAGSGDTVSFYRGNAPPTGYDLISGYWYSGPGQVDVPTRFLTLTGKAVGDTVTFSIGGARVTARIVGEVLDTDNHGLLMLTDWGTLAAADHGLVPDTYDVALRPGTSPDAYARRAGPGARRHPRSLRRRQRQRPGSLLPHPDRPGRHPDPAARGRRRARRAEHGRAAHPGTRA